jgi:hypothetical protein
MLSTTRLTQLILTETDAKKIGMNIQSFETNSQVRLAISLRTRHC